MVGCGGGSSSSSDGSSNQSDNSGNQNDNNDEQNPDTNNNENILTGIFVDSAVAGAGYATETQSGFTNSAGEYSYINGENVTFSIGSLVFPTVPAAPQVSPVDMAIGTENAADTTTNIARLLQSIDEDGNPDNGIVISEDAADNAVAINFDVAADQFANEIDVTNFVANSGSSNTALIDADTANAHLNATLSGSDNTSTVTPFTVASLNDRFLIPTPEAFATGSNARGLCHR